MQGSDVELQNIAFGLKALLLGNDSKAVTAGVRIEAPTKEDSNYPLGNLTLPQEVWAVTPYLATLINLNDDLFFQAFASYRLQTDDFAASSGDLIDGTLFREPNYFDLDAQLGYWLYRNTGGSGLTGLQAKTEIHYTGTFEVYDDSLVVAPAFPMTRGETDQLNLTTGLTAIVNDRTTITAGIVLPIREGSDYSHALVLGGTVARIRRTAFSIGKPTCRSTTTSATSDPSEPFDIAHADSRVSACNNAFTPRPKTDARSYVCRLVLVQAPKRGSPADWVNPGTIVSLNKSLRSC